MATAATLRTTLISRSGATKVSSFRARRFCGLSEPPAAAAGASLLLS